MPLPTFKIKNMADASTQTEAPLKQRGRPKSEKEGPTNEELALAQEFDPFKKYMFELADRNIERELPVINMVTKRPEPHKPFKPFQNIVFTSQIVWNGQRRVIRYYDGCTTIFVDEQPKDKDTIDQFIKQTAQRNFLEGKFGANGDERMLLLYLNICSWNADSPFRTKSANAIFVPVNADKRATAESLKLDETEQALELAKNASVSKMMIHAEYLDIPVEDFDSGNELSEKEIRIAYRKEALRNSAAFISSFGNKSLETKYYIKKAYNSGVITSKNNPNKVQWNSSGKEICDISGLKSPEAICEKIFEFSQLEEGAEFEIQLKALYN